MNELKRDSFRLRLLTPSTIHEALIRTVGGKIFWVWNGKYQTTVDLVIKCRLRRPRASAYTLNWESTLNEQVEKKLCDLFK